MLSYSYSSIIVLALSLALPANSQVDGTSNTCSAFSSNGLAAANYQYYRLYDFRNIAANTSTNERRSSLSNRASTVAARNKTVSDSTWTDDWYIRDYPRASPGAPSIPIDFTPSRVFITQDSDGSSNYTSYLTLSTARIDNETQEAGEITFQEFNASFASIRVYGRVRGASGAVAGIFTYLNDTQESDIEMFTRNPSQHIQYSNQPSSTGDPDWTLIPGATVNNTMPNSETYGDWLVHRLDWTPGRSVFFVDDVMTNTTTLQVPVADPPSGIYLDMWSANSTWSGSMDVGLSAVFDVQWIELLFNVTEAPAQVKGGAVCTVGAVDQAAAGTKTATGSSTAATAAATTTKKSMGVKLAAWGWGAVSVGSLLVVRIPYLF